MYPLKEQYQNAKKRREIDLLQEINHPNILNVESLDSFYTNQAVKESNLIRLKDVIDISSLKEAVVINIALEILKGLDYLWEKGIVYNNVGPNSILVNVESNIVKLADFKVFSEIKNEAIHDYKISSLEGELQFISPELTGRMNRSVDLRSDIYSLGALMYYCLSGKFLFQNEKEAHKIIHCHLTKMPNPLTSEVSISTFLESIIFKMLAKNPRSRYQTAIGLRYDLEKCKEFQLDKLSSIHFSVGKLDERKTFRLDESLHGREKEISKIMKSYNNVINSRSRLFLVSGHSGIGKTALVNEVKKPMTEHSGTFIQGKFDQLKKSIPFYGFNYAIEQLIEQIYTEKSEYVDDVRKKLIDTLGDNLRIIASVIPSVKKFTGYSDKDKGYENLSDSQNLFYTTFTQFFSFFKDSNSPLVIFLDDLQWADSSTIGLVKHLITNIHDKNLFIVAGYRDNEVNSNHPWQIAINEVIDNGGIVDFIAMESLTVKDVEKIISNSFLGMENNLNTLAQIIWSKSGGNPFYIQNLIKTFYENKYIYFDDSRMNWLCNIDQIMNSDISPNLIGLILGSINKLPQDLIMILKSASAVGTHFNAKTLRDLLGISNELCSKAVVLGLQEKIILSIDNSYRYIKWEESKLEEIKFKFSHDKIQQALYEDLSEEDKFGIHFKVAQTLNQTPEEHVFELAFHYNKLIGSSYIDNEILSKINYQAGLRAYDSSAFESAKTFFEISYNSTPEDAWETDYKNVLRLAILLFECCYLSNDNVNAQKLNDLLLKKVQTANDKSRVYEIIMNYYSQKGRANEAIEIGSKALKLYGISFPKKATLFHVAPKLVGIKMRLLFKSESSLLNAKLNTNAKSLAALRILSNMTPSCFIQSPESFLLNSLFCLQLALKHGNSDVSSFAFSLMGIIEANAFGNISKAKKILKLAMRMNEKFKSKTYLPKIIFAWDNFVQFYHGPIRESVPWLNKGYASGIDSGDFNFANYCFYSRVSREIFLGMNFNSILKSVTEFSQFSLKVGDNLMIPVSQIYRRYVKFCSDLEDDKYMHVDKRFEEASFLKAVDHLGDFQSRTFYFIVEIIMSYYAKKYDKVIRISLDIFSRIEDGTQKQLIFYEYYFYSGLAAARLLKSKDLDLYDFNNDDIKKMLRKSLRVLKRMNELSPANFGARYSLLKAEADFSDDFSDTTVGSYNRSIILSGQNEMSMLEALAYELYADYLLKHHFSDLALVNYSKALDFYEKISFVFKVNYLKTMDQLSKFSTMSISENQFKEVTTKMSNLISNQKGIESLLEKLNEQILYYSNAQRSLIVLKNEKEYVSYTSDLNKDFCISMVDYSYNSGEFVRISDAANYHTFLKDAYFQNHKIVSIASFPLIANDSVKGVIYLENNLIKNAFDESKTMIVEVLTSQIALAIENAFFVDELEEKVSSRTKLLESKRLELEKSNSEKEVLVRVLCHDLANIVTVKNHSLRALEKILSRNVDDNISKYIDKMKIALKNESYIINNVRTLEMAKNKLLKVELGLVNIHSKLIECISTFEDQLLNKQITVDIDPRIMGVEVLAEDVGLGVNVLNNIFSNAIKFSFNNSKIKVYISESSADKIVLCIQDFGVGMSKEFLSSIFKTDVHQSSNGTSNEKGTGFGLNIIKVFMHKFNGHVRVKSVHKNDSPDHGTTFKLEFQTR